VTRQSPTLHSRLISIAAPLADAIKSMKLTYRATRQHNLIDKKQQATNELKQQPTTNKQTIN
jgi:hypothetical protein